MWDHVLQNILVTPLVLLLKGYVSLNAFEPTKTSEVLDIIMSLKNSSPGHDEIPASLIKKVAALIIDPLTNKNKNFNVDKAKMYINGNVLEQVSSVKVVGVYIDEKMCFKNHCEFVCKKVSKSLGIIKRVKQHLKKRYTSNIVLQFNLSLHVI